jgi:ketosteroid isomerase-like protein
MSVADDNKQIVREVFVGQYCFIYRLAGGRITEVTEYLDTELVTEVLGGGD